MQGKAGEYTQIPFELSSMANAVAASSAADLSTSTSTPCASSLTQKPPAHTCTGHFKLNPLVMQIFCAIDGLSSLQALTNYAAQCAVNGRGRQMNSHPGMLFMLESRNVNWQACSSSM